MWQGKFTDDAEENRLPLLQELCAHAILNPADTVADLVTGRIDTIGEKTVEERILNALNNHKKGYNCSQSVACAFCDLVGVDEDTMFRMMEAYGYGMGNAEGTCGAMSGAIAVLGMKNSTGCEKIGSKKDSYAKAKVMMEKFAEKNSSVVCKELKGLTGGPVLRTCDGCIEDAARLVAEYLTAQN